MFIILSLVALMLLNLFSTINPLLSFILWGTGVANLWNRRQRKSVAPEHKEKKPMTGQSIAIGIGDVIGGIILWPVIAMLIFGIGWSLSNTFTRRLTPTTPDATFPFRIEYTIDGESFVIEDTLVIEFVSSNFMASVGHSFQWHRWLVSDPSNDGFSIQLLALDDEVNTTVNYSLAGNEFLMGRDTWPDWHADNPTYILFDDPTENRPDWRSRRQVNATFLYDNFGLVITHFEMAPPIENSFE